MTEGGGDEGAGAGQSRRPGLLTAFPEREPAAAERRAGPDGYECASVS